MPKTIIKVKTYMCPSGLENINAECRFHRASNNLPEDGKCPDCQEVLVIATHPHDQITMTILGEEDIEKEIEHIKVRKKQEVRGGEDDPDVSTKVKEDAYREKRKKDIKDAILKAKKLEHK